MVYNLLFNNSQNRIKQEILVKRGEISLTICHHNLLLNTFCVYTMSERSRKSTYVCTTSERSSMAQMTASERVSSEWLRLSCLVVRCCQADAEAQQQDTPRCTVVRRHVWRGLHSHVSDVTVVQGTVSSTTVLHYNEAVRTAWHSLSTAWYSWVSLNCQL